MTIGADRGRPARPAALVRLVAMAAVLLAGAAGAQAPEGSDQAKAQVIPAKPAWKWTLEERLAARFEPEGMKRRVAREAEMARKSAAQFGERFDIAPDQQSIDGKSEPELFTPIELFDSLLSSAFHESARAEQEMRSWIEDRAAVLGLGSDLWVRLEKVAAPYLRLRDERSLRALQALSQSKNHEDSVNDKRALCRARAEALTAAKAEFGEETFLRLLYEVRASTMSLTYSAGEGSIDHLRYIEGGCR